MTSEKKRRSDAQERAVSKAGKASGERRKGEAKRKRNAELREGQERARSQERLRGGLVTLPEAADRAGCEYRTLHKWVAEGIVEPTHPPNGAGYPAYLTAREAEICEALVRMRNAGCGLDQLKGAWRAFASKPRLLHAQLHSGDGVVVTVMLRPPREKAAADARPSEAASDA